MNSVIQSHSWQSCDWTNNDSSSSSNSNSNSSWVTQNKPITLAMQPLINSFRGLSSFWGWYGGFTQSVMFTMAFSLSLECEHNCSAHCWLDNTNGHLSLLMILSSTDATCAYILYSAKTSDRSSTTVDYQLNSWNDSFHLHLDGF